MMKILLITDEEWNDYVHGNGVLTNWFTGFDADFAQVYCSPGKPVNAVCDQYFQITDTEMAKSLFGKKRAGGIIKKESGVEYITKSMQNAQRKGIYEVMKRISLWMHTPVMMLRDFIWCYGRYNTKALKVFIDNFQPDIVYCPRVITPKLMRLEKMVSIITDAPFVAFTADDEASMTGINCSLLYWLRKYAIHNCFKKHITLYSHYLMFSADQAEEYCKEYGIATSTFFKCGTFSECFESKEVGKPIRMVYAGRLYCNRWKSLAEIGKVLKDINNNGIRMVLDIYTTEQLTMDQRKALSEESYIYVKGCVTSDELNEIYQRADIALHVESMDKKNRLLTRVSFSTKIIDLMASSCAIMAVCWDKHTGYQYLKKKDAAFCLSSYDDILPLLNKICETPSLVQEYAEKAYNCGKMYHSREVIQGQLKKVFEKVIAQKK